MVGRLWRQLVQRLSGANLLRQRLPAEALLGRQGEEAAYWYLREQGVIIVDRNYRPEGQRGEIDLIGWDRDTLVFVEVKTRGAAFQRQPEAAVDWEKEHHILAAARVYRRQAHRLSAPVRFDIVSVVTSPEGMKIEHFRDAFRETAASASRH